MFKHKNVNVLLNQGDKSQANKPIKIILKIL